MYGFTEPWLAELLNMSYEPFGLNSGETAAIIDFNDYANLMSVVSQLSSENGSVTPQDINSDVSNMKIILHEYWADNGLLDGLTSGETKSGETYNAIMQKGLNRFDMEHIKQEVARIYQQNFGPLNVGNTVTEAPPVEEAVPAEVVEEEAAEELFDETAAQAEVPHPPQRDGIEIPVDREAGTVNMVQVDEGGNPVNNIETEPVTPAVAPDPMDEALSVDDNTAPEPAPEPTPKPIPEPEPEKVGHERLISNMYEKGFSIIDTLEVPGTEDLEVVVVGYGSRYSNEPIFELARSTGKHIVLVTEEGSSIERRVKKLDNFSDIYEHTIFLVTSPCAPHFLLSKVSHHTKTLCLGHEVKDLYVVAGRSVDSQIEHINSNGGDPDEIERVKNSYMPSSYSRYDEVFKDTITNSVWAVRNRCFVYLLFPYNNNVSFSDVALKETGNRIGGKIPYEGLRMIDSDYHQEIENQYQEDYVNFAIDSSKTFIKELKAEYESSRKKYKEHLEKAMEYGKVTQKLLNTIEGFDEEGFVEKERKKAMKSYQDTLAVNKISSIHVKDGVINVYTHNIYAKHDTNGTWHDIGTFHIMIGMMSNQYDTNNTVKILNTKHQIYGMSQNMQAPHVFPEGYICHGNLAAGMTEAYKQRNLFDLVMMLVIFLQSANLDDAAGKHLHKWPEVSEEVALKEDDTSEDVFAQISEAEKQFDDVLAEAIPINI